MINLPVDSDTGTVSIAEFGQLGLLTMAYGKEHFCQLAENLALTAQYFAPNLPRAIVTEASLVERFRESFHHVIVVDPNRGKGMRQKLYLYDYSPFEETIVLDADTLILQSLDGLIQDFREHGEFVVLGRAHQTEDWRYSFRLARKHFGVSWIAQFNGGCYYFRRGAATEKIVRRAQELMQDWSGLCRCLELSLDDDPQRPRPPGVSEELLLSLALAESSVEPLDDFDRRRMVGPVQMRAGSLRWNLVEGKCVAGAKAGRSSPTIGHFFWWSHEGFHYKREIARLRHRMKHGHLGWLFRGAIGMANFLYGWITSLFLLHDRMLGHRPASRYMQAGYPLERFSGRTSLGLKRVLDMLISRLDRRSRSS